MRPAGKIALAVAVLVAATPKGARAEASEVGAAGADAEAHASPDVLSRADVLFRVGQELRAAGLYADACPKFAETQRLLPGIGVTLYLADCYEHLDRPARAWMEFRRAERLARQRNDSRAQVAHTRAAALEPKLKRVTIAVSSHSQQEGLEVTFDGAAVPPDRWNVALATDAGDHVLGFRLRGRDPQSIRVRIDPQTPPMIVPVGEEARVSGASAPTAAAPARASSQPAVTPSPSVSSTPASSTPPASAAPPAAVPAPTPPPAAAAPPAAAVAAAPPSAATAVAPPAATATVPATAGFHLDSATRSTLEIGLVVGGLAALAAGAGFLALKNHAIETDQTSSAGVVSAAAFGLGGAALVSSIVLYLTAPSDKSSAIVFSAVPLTAGAEAAVVGRF